MGEYDVQNTIYDFACKLRFTVSCDAAKIANNWLASSATSQSSDLEITPASANNSNQNTVSSASSTTIPSFARNSGRDRARHAAL
jgi:hypothetical protein